MRFTRQALSQILSQRQAWFGLVSQVIGSKAADVAELADALDSKFCRCHLQNASQRFTQYAPNRCGYWLETRLRLETRAPGMAWPQAGLRQRSVAKSVAYNISLSWHREPNMQSRRIPCVNRLRSARQVTRVVRGIGWLGECKISKPTSTRPSCGVKACRLVGFRTR